MPPLHSPSPSPLLLPGGVLPTSIPVPVPVLLLLSFLLLSLPHPTLSEAGGGVKNAWNVYGGGCQGGCSGHGTCIGEKTPSWSTASAASYLASMFERNGAKVYGGCSCFDGYTGTDCNQRLCPKGRHWGNTNIGDVSTASNPDVAHEEGTECSGWGFCDRKTGNCNCRAGWEGSACQYMACPNGNNAWGQQETCSGHGRCTLVNDWGMDNAFRDPHGPFGNYEDANSVATTDYAYWDAEHIKGCECDLGYSGFNCAKKDCPWGEDPEKMSTTLAEVQTLSCRCDATCSGSFKLTYRDATTVSIPYDATSDFLERALERLPAISDVEVTTAGTAGQLCTTGSAALTSITWLRDKTRSDSFPLITVDISGLSTTATGTDIKSASVTRTQATTKVPLECSGRGTCSADTSLCKCYPGYYATSDGRGGVGTKKHAYRDCGTRDPVAVSNGFFTSYTCPELQPIWGGTLSVCGLKGTCNTLTHACSCNAGYEGGACEWLSCSKGRAWFGKGRAEPHNMMPCSNRGTCERKTGSCKCPDLFEGTTCNLMACAKNNSLTCGDKGTCMTMAKIATYSTTNGQYNGAVYNPSNATWDANKIQACYCRKSFSANAYMWPFDERFPSLDLDTYRGYNAYTHTDATAFDCSRSECPRGDDPLTLGGLNEIQRLSCDATGGNFTLKYRENTTTLIYWSDTIATLKTRLEKLSSIGGVIVTATNPNNTICSQNHVDIEFYTELGDLPTISIKKAHLTGAKGVPKYHCSGTNVASCTPGFSITGTCGGTGVDAPVLHRCGCAEGYYSFETTCACNCVEVSEDNHNKGGRTSSYNPLLWTAGEDFPGETNLGSLQITEVRKGTKENLECSGHGYCNPDIGMCTCDDGFISSDGNGKPGHRGDCGIYVSETSKFALVAAD